MFIADTDTPDILQLRRSALAAVSRSSSDEGRASAIRKLTIVDAHWNDDDPVKHSRGGMLRQLMAAPSGIGIGTLIASLHRGTE